MSNCASPNSSSNRNGGWQAFAAQRRRQVVAIAKHAHAATPREHATRRKPATHRPALTLVEVVVSTMIVGLMTVAALQGLGAATRSSQSAGNRGVALGLADDLMAEVLATAYSDPDGSATFGLETGETAPRVNFDDVDDFHGWNQTPPQAADGTTIADRVDWRQRITVQRVTPADPRQTTAGNTDQGAKRICVTIEFNNVVLAEEYAVVTDVE